MVLAFSTILLIGGTGLVLAGGPDPNSHPVRSMLLGPTLVQHGASAQYTLRVLFSYGTVLDFPPTYGANFTAVKGTINPDSVNYPVIYMAPATGSKDRITGTFSQNGNTISSSLIITLQ